MEKLRFTIRFMVILVGFPVIMFTELTRSEKAANDQKESTTEKISVTTDDAELLGYDTFTTQVVYN